MNNGRKIKKKKIRKKKDWWTSLSKTELIIGFHSISLKLFRKFKCRSCLSLWKNTPCFAIKTTQWWEKKSTWNGSGDTEYIEIRCWKNYLHKLYQRRLLQNLSTLQIEYRGATCERLWAAFHNLLIKCMETLNTDKHHWVFTNVEYKKILTNKK